MRYFVNKLVCWEIILFSALGCFSLFFIAEYSEYAEPLQGVVFSPKNCMVVALIFNVIGLSLVYIYRKIQSDQQLYLRKCWQVGAFFLVTACVILFLNYLLIVVSRVILGIPKTIELTIPEAKSLLLVWLVELVIVSQFIVSNFYRNLIELYKRTTKLEESETKRKYQMLQNQLNPHFLFNNLNTLVSEIEYDPKVAVKFTCSLSDVYRYILQCQNKNTVSLSEELSFMSAYMYLHLVRMGECIEFDIQIPEDLYDAQLPPLTLQLLAENVVKHNVISMDKTMKINLYVESDNNWLCMSNFKSPKQGVAPSGKGLENLRQRFLLLTGEEIVVENGKELFTVKVPLFYE